MEDGVAGHEEARDGQEHHAATPDAPVLCEPQPEGQGTGETPRAAVTGAGEGSLAMRKEETLSAGTELETVPAHAGGTPRAAEAGAGDRDAAARGDADQTPRAAVADAGAEDAVMQGVTRVAGMLTLSEDMHATVKRATEAFIAKLHSASEEETDSCSEKSVRSSAPSMTEGGGDSHLHGGDGWDTASAHESETRSSCGAERGADQESEGRASEVDREMETAEEDSSVRSDAAATGQAEGEGISAASAAALAECDSIWEGLSEEEKKAVSQTIQFENELERVQKGPDRMCPACEYMYDNATDFVTHVIGCLLSAMWVCPVYGCEHLSYSAKAAFLHVRQEEQPRILKKRKGMHEAYCGVLRKERTDVHHCVRRLLDGEVVFVHPDDLAAGQIYKAVARANLRKREQGPTPFENPQWVRVAIRATAKWVYMGSEPPPPAGPPKLRLGEQGFEPPRSPVRRSPVAGSPGGGTDDSEDDSDGDGQSPGPIACGREQRGPPVLRHEIAQLVAGIVSMAPSTPVAQAAETKVLFSAEAGSTSLDSRQPGQVLSSRVFVPKPRAGEPPLLYDVAFNLDTHETFTNVETVGQESSGARPRVRGAAEDSIEPAAGQPLLVSDPDAESIVKKRTRRRGGRRWKRLEENKKRKLQSWEEQVADATLSGTKGVPYRPYGTDLPKQSRPPPARNPPRREEETSRRKPQGNDPPRSEGEASRRMPQGTLPAGAERDNYVVDEMRWMREARVRREASQRYGSILETLLREVGAVTISDTAAAPPVAAFPLPTLPAVEMPTQGLPQAQSVPAEETGGVPQGHPASLPEALPIDPVLAEDDAHPSNPWNTQSGKGEKREEQRLQTLKGAFEEWSFPEGKTPAERRVLWYQYRARIGRNHLALQRYLLAHEVRNLGGPIRYSEAEAPGLAGNGQGTRGEGRNKVPNRAQARDVSPRRRASGTTSTGGEGKCTEGRPGDRKVVDPTGRGQQLSAKCAGPARVGGAADEALGARGATGPVVREVQGVNVPLPPVWPVEPAPAKLSQVQCLRRFAETAPLAEGVDQRALQNLTAFQRRVLRCTPGSAPDMPPLYYERLEEKAEKLQRLADQARAGQPKGKMVLRDARGREVGTSRQGAGKRTAAATQPVRPAPRMAAPTPAPKTPQPTTVSAITETMAALALGAGGESTPPPAPSVLQDGQVNLGMPEGSRVTVYDGEGRPVWEVCVAGSRTPRGSGDVAALLARELTVVVKEETPRDEPCEK
jgi:hypothetical protein